MNNALVKTREISVITDLADMDIPAAIKWASGHVNAATGWLLAESPRQIVWNRFCDAPVFGRPEEIERLLIFGPNAELRLEKPYGAAAGTARLIMAGDKGALTFERKSWYRLDKSRRLAYAEHFLPDPEHGILQLAFARFCGVDPGGE